MVYPKAGIHFYNSLRDRREECIHCTDGWQTIPLPEAIVVNGKTPVHISSRGVFKGLI